MSYQSGGIDFGKSKYGIGVFSNDRDLELAVNDLNVAQFPLSQLSIITQQVERFSSFSGMTVRDRVDAMRLGMPVERARFYNDQLNHSKRIVIVNGTEQELHQAATILHDRHIQAWQMYDPTAIDAMLSVEPDLSPTPSLTPQGLGNDASIATLEGIPSRELVKVVTVSTEEMLPKNRVVAQAEQEAILVFKTLQQAETVLTKLQSVHFPMQQTSILVKHHAAKISAKLSHLVVGVGRFDVPGMGTVLVGGAIATSLVAAALAKGAIATTEGLTQALIDRGISSEKAKTYNDRLLQGNPLIFVNGVREELLRAEAVLQPQELSDWDVYPSPRL